MEGERVKIEKLVDSSNWMQWKFQVRVFFDVRDALELIDGSHIPPLEGAANYDAELKRWKRANKVAKEIFATTLEKKPLGLIMNCENARAMWIKLLDVYEQKSADSVYLLQTQFREYRYTPGDDIADHVSKIETFARRLDELGEPVSDTMLMTTILNTLPSQYRHFHSAWDSTPAGERSLSRLISRLMVEETRLGIQDINLNSESALLVAKRLDGRYAKPRGSGHAGSSNDKGITKNKKFTLRCWKCGGPHYRRNCPKKRQDGADANPNKEKEASHGLALLLNTHSPNVLRTSKWIIDSGCTEHVCWRLDYFVTFHDLTESVVFALGDGRKVQAEGKGHIRIRSNVDGREHYIRDAMYVPEMKANLFSVRSAAAKGFRQTIEGDRWLFQKDDHLIVEGTRDGDMYVLDIGVIQGKKHSFVARSHKEDSLQIWHERLGHQSKGHVRELLTARGIEVLSSERGEFCDGCALGKFQRTNFREMPKAVEAGELVVTDVCGPMHEPSMRHSRYFVTFKDDFTQFRRVYFMQHKHEVLDHLRNYLAYVQTQTGVTVKTLMSDGGGEYTDHKLVEYLNQNGIEFGRSAAYTPQQNGRAERENRTLLEMARSMLLTHGLSKRFWAEAVNCAAYILNRTGKSRDRGKTPYELWYGREYSLGHLRIFGSECFVRVPKQRRHDKKFGGTGKRGTFVGYEEVTGNYRVWLPDENRIEISRDVEFLEVSVPGALVDSSQGEHETSLSEIEDHHTDEAIGDEALQTERVRRYNLRDRSTLQPPNRLSYLCRRIVEPQSYREALEVPEKRNWIEAMKEEMTSHERNETWELVERDFANVPLTCKWVFRVKKRPNGEVERFKARLVIRGFQQRCGVDYDETFSPVVRYDTVRFLFWLKTADKMEIVQFDCKTAFLNGTLHELIYMEQPEGFQDGSGRVCRLLKSLYGLKQAPRCWNERLTTFLISLGFTVSKLDPCVYIRRAEGGLVVVAVYVDDGLILTKCKRDVFALLRQLTNEFEITVCEEVGQFLGFQIDKLDDGGLKVHQEAYAQDTLSMFGMTDCRPSQVPVDRASVDLLNNETEADMNNPVASAVGRLMYLVVVSRPDLAYAVGKAAKWMSKPTVGSWKFILKILKYLKATVDKGIVYRGLSDGYISVFCDADYAGDVQTRRSTTGYISTLGDGAVTWTSQRQACVALSTTEAEYMAASMAAKELVWLSNLVREFKPGLQARLLVDNQGAIRLASNPESHKRTKHIDVRFHYIRELVTDKRIVIEYVGTDKQMADLLTKPLSSTRFRELCQSIGLH